jgi:GNAT superfamily N-acetyltransferase
MDVDAEDFEGEWAELWEDPLFPLHVVAERDGRTVGHALLYHRPTGDLRVPEQNVDLAHAATLTETRGSGAGLALTAHVLSWAHEHGYRSMTTDWRSVNSSPRASGHAAGGGRPTTGSTGRSREDRRAAQRA